MDINKIILNEIANLGVAQFALDWGFTENAVKTVQRTKKPSAAMLTKAFELMQTQPAPQAQAPTPAPRRQRASGRGPVPQPFRRAPGVAPMFTQPDGMDQPASAVRPAAGAPFVVPPTGAVAGQVPTRHPGIALGQLGLHAPQQRQLGVVIPPGVDPGVWQMFLQFMAMMGVGGQDQAQEIQLPGGHLEMPQDYGHGWNVPHGYRLVRDDEAEQEEEQPRRRRQKIVKKKT